MLQRFPDFHGGGQCADAGCTLTCLIYYVDLHSVKSTCVLFECVCMFGCVGVCMFVVRERERERGRERER